jgi:hypothetical protein
VCEHDTNNLAERFGCPSACEPCANFFKRTCMDNNFYIDPDKCVQNWR